MKRRNYQPKPPSIENEDFWRLKNFLNRPKTVVKKQYYHKGERIIEIDDSKFTKNCFKWLLVSIIIYLIIILLIK